MKRPTILALFGMILVAPAGAEEADLQVIRNVTYAKADNVDLKLDIYGPKSEGAYPAVLLVHGGGWRFGTKTQLTHHGLRLAKMGYVAFSIDYRHAPRHKFPAQINDCRSALIWIRKHADKYHVDPSRVAAAGYSAGGHLVCLLAAQGKKPQGDQDVDTRISAVVAGGAPCDFRSFPKDSTTLAYWLGGTRSEKSDTYRAASPVEFASAQLPPMFFYNGTRDKIVPLSWTEPMVDRARDLGVEVTWYKVEDAGHFAAFLNKQAIDHACEFLDKHMKAKTGSEPDAK